MTGTRRVVALAAGLVLSTLLLGGGWLGSTLRERELAMREARGRLARTADVVRGAVDESLEALRRREDQRPFYLYNHFYSPPDVLALSDPIAVSPLAHPPDDPRVIGHFQVEPGGRVRTPYTPDDDAEPPPLARRVRAAIEAESLAPIRALATGEAGGLMLPRATDEAGALLGSLTGLQALEDGEAQTSLVGMNEWGNSQAQDIQAAQAGDPYANARLIERGRQVPRISRRDVSWSRYGVEPQGEPQNRANGEPARDEGPDLPARPARGAVRAALEAVRPDVEACTSAEPIDVRVRVRGAEGAPIGVSVTGVDEPAERVCVERALAAVRLPASRASTLVVRYRYARSGAADALPAAPHLTDASGLDNMVRREAEVEYTPMAFREADGELVLHRVVSHGELRIVQGVLLDEAHLAGPWLSSLVDRHAAADARPEVVAAGEGECVVRRPASAILTGAELCFPPAALAAATGATDRELRYQIGALAALWLIALLAAVAIVAAARRAEALSRQKSAFVSAVSHELRTPLTTLRMHAEMLDEGMVSEARRPKVHRELVRESVRLARLVDNVLSLSKLEEGRRRLHRTEGDLRAHVRDVVEGQRRFVEERGFTLRAPETKGVSAVFDAQAVEQIVVNLLDNATKYGRGEVDEIEVWVGHLDGAPAIAVRDRGPGIPAADHERVFERFHRVEREETAHAPGTGIGLALVAELAAAHGGRATVHPRDDGGLEVRVTLG